MNKPSAFDQPKTITGMHPREQYNIYTAVKENIDYIKGLESYGKHGWSDHVKMLETQLETWQAGLEQKVPDAFAEILHKQNKG